MRVGLTGNIGSGKSTVAEIFSKLGVPVYHADAVAKEFLLNNDVKAILRNEFGETIFTDNEINKQALADIVFNNVDKLNKLNQVIHPFVIEDYENWTKKHTKSFYSIIEAAILLKPGMIK